jgi:hypothetical protein
MTLTAKTLPAACVFDITVEGEFVSIAWHPGRLFELGNDEPIIGRRDARGSSLLCAQTDVDEDGDFTRSQLDGYVTTSARDALLWASELAQGDGAAQTAGFRLAIEVDHAVVAAALGGV